jgi:outer membrane immunogenic protein
MGLSSKIAVAAVIAATPASALATDMLTVPTSANDNLPVANSGFDWNTFYAGVYGIAQSSPVGGGQYGIGVDVGVSSRLEFVLVGAEVTLQALTGAGSTIYGEGVGRAGIALTDDLVLYGAGGIGSDFAGQTDALIGGGLEVAVTDTVTVDARYLHGIAVSGANPKEQVKVGANFHF